MIDLSYKVTILYGDIELFQGQYERSDDKGMGKEIT